MSTRKNIHLFVDLVLQNQVCEIACSMDLDLLQVISHMTLLAQFNDCRNDCRFDLKRPYIIEEGSQTVLDLSKTIRQLNLKDGMVLRMYL